MDKKPSIDIGIIAPILLGFFSFIGIGAVLLYARSSNERVPVPTVPTETPFRYIYLGTEPGLSTLTPEATDTPEATPTSLPPPVITFAPTRNNNNNNNLPTQTQSIIVRTPTATITPTLQSVLSKVDDTYFELLYTGDWTAQSNVEGVHQNTLHISFSTGNSVEYTFVGQQVIVSYQAAPSLGRVSINLDGLVVEVDQSFTRTEIFNWTSPILVRGTHTLVMEHISGGSINLDSITIPDVLTATPTSTPTSTP